MNLVAQLAVLVVSILHFLFMILEMVFWTKPLGLRIFKQKKAQAESSAMLAKNQGLYNGCLAVGLAVSVVLSPPIAFAFQIYLLGSVIAVGLYGAWTVSRGIFFVQALPAIIALILVYSFPV